MTDPGQLPFVSVIIPARNAARHLTPTLAALLAGDYPPSRMEVLVVDGASTDDTAARVNGLAARDPRLRRLLNPAGSTPVGLNIGLHAAQGSIVVRLDAHALPAPDYVSACVAALGRTGAAAVGGRMVGVGSTPFGRAVALATRLPFGAGDAAFRRGGEGPVDTVYLGAWPRTVFDEVGYFDEGLPRNQDYELCERIRRAGGVVWLDPAIRSTTVTRGDPAALARLYFGYGMGRAGTVARHPGSLSLRQVVPAGFVAGLLGLTVLGTRWRWARWGVGAVLGAYGAATEVAARGPFGQASAFADAGADVDVDVVVDEGAGERGVVRRGDLRVAFWVMHLCWGVGFWVGVVREGLGVVTGRGRRG
jgi:hypothetical protein